MSTGKNSRSRRERGQEFLESALVTLILANMLIGIFDLGQVLFIRQTFAARARSAARYGAVHDASETVIRNMVLYGQVEAPEGASLGTFGLSAGMVSVAKLDVGSSEQRVVVTISGYPYRFFTPWISGVRAGHDVAVSAPLETP